MRKSHANAGFSLIEIMIGSTVAAGILLGLTEMLVNQAKMAKSAQAKVDFIQMQQQIQTAAASPLAIKASSEAVGIAYRGFYFPLLDLSQLLSSAGSTTVDPTTLTPFDPKIYTKPPLFDPDIVYTNLAQVTPPVLDPYRPVTRLPGSAIDVPPTDKVQAVQQNLQNMNNQLQDSIKTMQNEMAQ